MQDIILANFVTIFHSILVYWINSYIYRKAPGAQTLYDFVFATVLKVQVILIWTVVLTASFICLLKFVSMDDSVKIWLAWLNCALIVLITFHHNLYIILLISVRYVSIYHFAIITSVDEKIFLKIAQRFIFVVSVLLTIAENLGPSPFKYLSLYNLYLDNLDAPQFGSRLNGYLFLTWTTLYLILQYCIERDSDAERRKDLVNDRWACIGVAIFFIISCIFLFGFHPTVNVMTWRICIQIIYTNVILLRFILHHENLFQSLVTRLGIQRFVNVIE